MEFAIGEPREQRGRIGRRSVKFNAGRCQDAPVSEQKIEVFIDRREDGWNSACSIAHSRNQRLGRGRKRRDI